MKTGYVNGILLDGTENMVPQKDKMVITEGSKIISVEYKDKAIADGTYRECQIVDLNGAYIMPGLINMHTHLASSGKPLKARSKKDIKKITSLMSSNPLTRRYAMGQFQKNAETELVSGVTTVRSMGGLSDLETTLRNDIATGKVEGPRILTCNMAISVPGGHMAGSLAYEATSPEEAASFVRKLVSQGVDLIKLMVTGGVLDADEEGEPGALKMSPDIIKAACDEAHRLGYKVSAHCESPAGVKEALRNGVDYIEHGAKPDQEMMDLFKEKGAALICTISPTIPYVFGDPKITGFTEMEQNNCRTVLDGIISCARACLEEGIPVGLGTDSGTSFTTHYDMWRELAYFSYYCGVSRNFALHTATRVNAGIAGLGQVTGTIEPGKAADMIMTEGNPLNDLEALRGMYMVVVRGKLIKEPLLDKVDQIDKLVDRASVDVRKNTEDHEELEKILENEDIDENARREILDRR